eukprot:TRINITY_DN57128_c0_g1_i1.p1 TRINITY_DN57128_c0_g1~~TRINITY_DN57128_c0_g1_i1.p1  ORF type:complete len:1083 (+),score=474.90 TRINITY_DN57128_c0_g1_i1:42-3290(+)
MTSTALGSPVSSMSYVSLEQKEGFDIQGGLARGKRKRRPCCCGRLSRRQCCLLVAVLVAVSVAAALVGFLVVAPAVINHAIHETQIEILAVNITQPRLASFHIAVRGTVANPMDLDAEISSMSVDVLFRNSVLGQIELPSMTLPAGQKQEFEVSSLFTLEHVETFNAFAHSMIRDDVVTWHMSGTLDTVSAKVAGVKLSFHGVAFEKDVQLQGCAGLTDVTLQVFDLTHSTEDAVVVVAKVLVVNPAVVDIDPVGALRFDMLYNGSYLGTLVSEPTSLMTGVNELHMTAELTPDNMTVASILMSRYLAGEPTTVQARATAHNASTYPLFDSALRGLVLDTTLRSNVTQLIRQLEQNSMALTPVDDASLTFSANFTAHLFNPLGARSPINITALRLESSTMTYVGDDGISVPIATLNMPHLLPVAWNGDAAAPSLSMLIQHESLALIEPGWTQFGIAALHSDSISVGLSGSAAARATLAIGDVAISNLPFTTTMHVAGMRGLPDVKTTSFALPSNSPLGGISLHVAASLVNPSSISMPLNDAVIDISLIEAETHYTVARVWAGDLMVTPGVVNASFSGHFDPKLANRSMKDVAPACGHFFSEYLGGRTQNVLATGVGVRPSRSPFTATPAWVVAVIQSLRLVISFPGAAPSVTRNLLSDATLVSTGMSFSATDPMHPVTSVDLNAHFAIPFGFQLDVPSISCNMTMYYGDAPVVGLDVPMTPVAFSFAKHTVGLSVSSLVVPILDVPSFQSFMTFALLHPSAPVSVRGTATAVSTSAAGTITIPALPVDLPLVFPGYSGFSGDISVGRVDFAATKTAGSVAAVIDITITNPAHLTCDLGPLTFVGTIGGSHHVLSASLPNFSLKYGSNLFKGVRGLLTRPADAAGQQAFRAFLSNYAQKKDQQVSLSADPQSSPIALLRPIMSSISVQVTVPGLQWTVLQDVVLMMTFKQYVRLFTGASKTIPTVGNIDNPFSTAISIVKCCLQVTTADSHSYELGYFDADMSSDPVVIPAASKTQTRQLPVQVKKVWDSKLFGAFWKALTKGSVTLRIKGDFTFRVGAFEQNIAYVQDLPAIVHNGKSHTKS